MENRVTVSICGEDYTLVAEEAPSYMQRVGGYVDTKLGELLATAKVGRTDAAVLAAVNIADELFKERDVSDGLRAQVKQYLDEASEAKNAVSELKRENFKLQQQIDSKKEGLQAQLKQYADEAAAAKNELSALKRENFKLQQKLDGRK